MEEAAPVYPWAPVNKLSVKSKSAANCVLEFFIGALQMFFSDQV